MTEDQQREAFEAWISAPPFERETDRFPQDETKFAWPGAYRDYKVELAWEAWQAACQWREQSAKDSA
jgi:hypothetical protein